MSDRDCENCKHHTEKGCDSWDCNFEQGMTREDAIKRLKLWLICSEEYTEDDVSMNEAIRIAINSLEIDEQYELEYEQIEPCEDAISRQAVLEFIGKQIDHSLWAFEKLVNGIKDLPPVDPQEPKTGHWKYNKCDKCSASRPPLFDNYCPNCGAKMEVGWR